MASAVTLGAGLRDGSAVFDRLRGLVARSAHRLALARLSTCASAPRMPSLAVVVALDEETYRTAPFKGSPTRPGPPRSAACSRLSSTAAPAWSASTSSSPMSLEQSGYRSATTPSARAARPRPPLPAGARRGTDAGKVVLGQVLRPNGATVLAGQRIVVHQRNIRPLNVHSDPDDIVRRLPLSFVVDGQPSPRCRSSSPHARSRSRRHRDAGSVTGRLSRPVHRRQHPDAEFRRRRRDIRTYSLADLRACVERDDKEFFRREVRPGKVVILGMA